jgi:hypothetical protein
MAVTTGTGGMRTARTTLTGAVSQLLASQPRGGLGGSRREGPPDGAGEDLAAGDADAADDDGLPNVPDGGTPDAGGCPAAACWAGPGELHEATASTVTAPAASTDIACPTGRCIVTSIAQALAAGPQPIGAVSSSWTLSGSRNGST